MSLSIKHFSVSLSGRQILQDVSLEIQKGKLHVLMGPNGSGKSTFAASLMGSESYDIQNPKSKIQINGKDISDMPTDERARQGLFLAFQNPIGIPGVNVANLLKSAYQTIRNPKSKVPNPKSTNNPALSVWDFNKLLLEKSKQLHIPQEFLRRSLNEEFSGGEKKKLEMLQAVVLCPKYAIFDEIDTGLDVDALKIVASGISDLKKQGTGVLVITHYQRILKYAKPDFVHILIDGKLVDSGDAKLANYVEKSGYKKWTRES
jgi:Fe-S cluster assembly ATP-binding protein